MFWAEITGSLSSITIGGAAEADLSGVVQVSGDIDNGGIIVGLSNSELRLMGTTDQNIGGGGTNQLYNLNVSIHLSVHTRNPSVELLLSIYFLSSCSCLCYLGKINYLWKGSHYLAFWKVD